MAPIPTRWQRLKGPLAGLVVASVLAAMTYQAATTLASGGQMPPRVRTRAAVFVELSYALARVLGVRGTVVVGAIAIGLTLVLIGRALQQPVGPGSVVRAPAVGAPRAEMIAAFENVRQQQRWFNVAQLGATLGVGVLGIKLSTTPAIAPVDATGFLASIVVLVAVTAVKVRAWKCPACGGMPGARTTKMCANCGEPLVRGLIEERARV